MENRTPLFNPRDIDQNVYLDFLELIAYRAFLENAITTAMSDDVKVYLLDLLPQNKVLHAQISSEQWVDLTNVAAYFSKLSNEVRKNVSHNKSTKGAEYD